jgi:hypothetical protein
MCTENHVCFGRIHGSQLREGANAGRHTPTLSLPPSHHCLDGEVYRGNRHYNVCEHLGLDTNQSLHHPPERDGRTNVSSYSTRTRTMVPLVHVTRIWTILVISVISKHCQYSSDGDQWYRYGILPYTGERQLPYVYHWCVPARYTCTRVPVRTRVRTCVVRPTYWGTYHWYSGHSRYFNTMVRTYVRTRVRTMARTRVVW